MILLLAIFDMARFDWCKPATAVKYYHEILWVKYQSSVVKESLYCGIELIAVVNCLKRVFQTIFEKI